MFERIFLVAAAAILLASLVGFVQVWLRIRIGAGLASRSIPYEQEGTGLKRILFAGDSTVVGTGVSDPKYSVAGRFGKEFPNYTIDNVAVDGLRLAEFPKTLEKADVKYDLVMMQVGANDVLRLHNLNKLENDARRAIRAAKEKTEKVIWMTSGNLGATEFFPRPIRYYYDFWTRKSRERFLKIAEEENILYVDLFTSVKDDPFRKDIEKFYAPDKLHLSDAGYGVWYDQIRKAMKEGRVDF
ncbi:SGNH/GDSL hydrolase family protein [Patescibacteria group bacterium]|nr:SGNH/GDSL hydrolase family protein [Patescibacteria group bacterium]